MEETPDVETLISTIKQRGWQDATRTILDVIEPVAPLVSQFLWVLQPMSSAIGVSKIVGTLAESLDTPQGIDHLRDLLDEKPR